jgi:hypothetical protein
MSKQTAVEWLVEKIENNVHHTIRIPREIIDQAEAMEKEQIEDAWDKRCSHGVVSQTWHIERKNGEQYYNETYGGDNV